MLPLYAKKVIRSISERRPLKATDVLYEKMHSYNKEAKEILNYLIEQIKQQNKNSPVLKQMYQLMQRADDIVIDCAHKLAPYQSPKLETIEVRNKVEHKFVLRAPKTVASVEEWAKLTGAEKIAVDEVKAKIKEQAPIVESLHDFDEIEDEINTQKHLLN